MLKRTISGAVYVAILATFFALRQLVDHRFFYILLWFFSAYGTFEMARAVKERSHPSILIIGIIFGVLLVPFYFVMNEYVWLGYGYLATILYVLFSIFVWVFATIFTKTTFGGVKWGILTLAYPSLFIIALLVANGMGLMGFTALLLIFIISPFSDVFAYLVGSLIGGPKLCPKLSPKKTWAGAVGGIVGAIVGAVILYFLIPVIYSSVDFQFPPVWIYIICGVAGGLLTEIGDLFESAIKRRLGIKDMGKIMPGHGGVMDRIDGTLFTAVFITLLLALV